MPFPTRTRSTTRFDCSSDCPAARRSPVLDLARPRAAAEKRESPSRVRAHAAAELRCGVYAGERWPTCNGCESVPHLPPLPLRALHHLHHDLAPRRQLLARRRQLPAARGARRGSAPPTPGARGAPAARRSTSARFASHGGQAGAPSFERDLQRLPLEQDDGARVDRQQAGRSTAAAHNNAVRSSSAGRAPSPVTPG
jgi:hypothetical protein